MKLKLIIACLSWWVLGAAGASALDVSIDDKAARAVLKAVQNAQLTHEEALAIARLPGSEGLIRKIKSYGREASEDMLADALVAAAQGKAGDLDKNFQFAKVRELAPQIEKTLDALADPSTHMIDEVKTRIALFSPATLKGTVSGYLIAGGTSGGFAFGDPEFFLNMMRFPSPKIAQTILEHELYHGVQGLAAAKESAKTKACLARLPGGDNLGELFGNLYGEGTASYVGDVLALAKSDDPVAEEQRKHLDTNVARVKRSVTLLELSVHAVTTSKIKYEDIYALGFYDDEILYALGYVMTKAIATEKGPDAVAKLLSGPPSHFVAGYAALSSYGKTPAAPALGALTLSWAKKAAACGA